MSTPLRRDLVGRVQTQALYGDRLRVTGIRRGWLHVVAAAQPTRRNSRGYPGWVPARQVTTHHPVARPTIATVIRPTSWLRTADGGRVIQLSIGTQLPVVGIVGSTVKVVTPTGQRRYLRSKTVVVHDPSTAALPPTRRASWTVHDSSSDAPICGAADQALQSTAAA